jgi:hypothetical protein
MTVARVIPTSIAPVVEQFELDGDLVVTIDRLGEVLREVEGGGGEPRQFAYELQRAGWLGSLRTRGAWEFLPAARAGAYGSGDRLIEFRAQHAVDPTWPGVLAMESAASVLGYAQRVPEREIVSLPPGVEPPKALAGDWRVVTLVLPAAGVTTVDRLPTWNLEGLIVGIATRPSAYQDMPGLGQWLPEAAGRVDAERLIGLLDAVPASARQRVAYLLAAGGNVEASAAVTGRYPPRTVAWFGQRRAGGTFDAATQVNVTALHRFLAVGIGA